MSSPQAPTPSASPTLDFGRCFTFLTEDPDWLRKLLIGGAFTLASVLIVGAFFVAGYLSRFVKAVAAGSARPLPEWDDLGGIFQDGLRIVGLYVLYAIGMVVAVALVACPFGLVFGGLAGLSRHGTAQDVLAALSGIGILFAYGLLLLLGLLVQLVAPAALVRVIFKEDLAAGFDFRAVFGFIRANLGNYLLSLVVFLLSNFLAQFGVVLCCVGVFPAIFWAYLTLGHALGETVRLNPASVG